MPNCPTVMCDMEPCEHGLKTNAHGCEVCECYEPPACTAIDTCDLSCTFGFELDENDCPICSCNNPCQVGKLNLLGYICEEEKFVKNSRI